MKLGEGFIEVRADRNAFDGDLGDLARRIRQGQGGAGDVSSALRDALIGGAFLAGSKKAIDAASELEQAVGGTAAVFGESASSIDRWSKQAAEGAGLSERAARELTSQIGGLLKGFGFTENAAADLSIQLASLGADLAATFGGKPEEAVQALAAALRGETDPIERYGIALNQALVNQRAVALGLAESTSKVDQHAKAQATLSLITERSADAQGQFAREAETAAGQSAIAAAKTENAAADLGENLLPIYTRLAETVGIVADAFGSLPEPVQTGVIALGAVVALSGPIKTTADALGSLGGIARTRAASGMETAGLRALYLRDGLGRVASVAAGPAAAALGILAIALFDAKQRADEMRQAAKELRDEAEQTGDTLEEVALRKLVEDFSETERTRDAMESLGVSFRDLREPLRGTREEYDRWLHALQEDHPGDVRVEILSRRVTEARGALGEAREATASTDEAVEELGISTDKTADSTQNLTTVTQEQVDALNDLLDATLAQFDADIDYRRSLDKTKDSLAEVLWLTNAGKTGSEEYEDAVLDAEEALLRQADAAVKLYEDTLKANGGTLDGKTKTDLYKQTLSELAGTLDKDSPLRKRLEEYIATLGLIPDSISTSISYTRPTVNPDARGFSAGGDVMDGLFRVHEGELLRKSGSEVEVISGSPTPVLAAGGDGAYSQEMVELLRLIAGNTAGPTTSTRLRRIQTTAGSI